MFKKLTIQIFKGIDMITHRSVLIPLCCAFTLFCIIVTGFDINSFIIYDDTSTLFYNTRASNIEDVLDEMKMDIKNVDIVSLSRSTMRRTSEIKILRGVEVKLQISGQTQELMAYATDRVSDLLERSNITILPNHVVTPPLDTPVSKNMQIVIYSLSKMRINEILPVDYKTTRRGTISLKPGEERVVKEGIKGERTRTYEITYKDDEEISRKLIKDQVTKKAVNEIVEYGMDQPVISDAGTITVGGETLKYRGYMEVAATAYTTENKTWKRTATGQTAKVGLVAVDPKVIPLGTRMYITSMDGKSWVYGVAVAADTGVKGKKVDLYFNTHSECISFGVRRAKVYILE